MGHVSIIKFHYLDASAAVKLFAEEEGSQNIRSFFSNESGFYMTQMCIAETFGVFKLKFMREEVSLDEYLKMCLIFSLHLQGKIKTDTQFLYNMGIHVQVAALAKRHQLDLSDAMQLFTLKKTHLRIYKGESQPILITADSKLAQAGIEENLRVWNCLETNAP